MPGLAPLSTSDPATVGPYRLLGVLGNGGMGRVYLGQSPAGRRLAIKVIHSELAEDPTFRARFAREVAAARSVSPLFTAAVIDADPNAPEPWLATTYIDGISLERQIVEHGPMSAQRAASLAAGLAEALSSIHAVGLVHRDLKPGNVLIDETGPHIIDFGLALGTMDLRVTTSLVVGTPSYMAPERLRGEDAGPPSDIFSFGATLVFATTGHDLVDDANVYQQVLQIAEGRYNLLGVPAGLRSLIVRCVSFAAKDRPTAPELTRTLIAFAAGDGSAAFTDETAATHPADDGRESAHEVSIVRQRTPNASMDPRISRSPHRTLDHSADTDQGPPAAPPQRRWSRRVLLGTGAGVVAVAAAGGLIAAAASAFNDKDRAAGVVPPGDTSSDGATGTGGSAGPTASGSPSPSQPAAPPPAPGDVLWQAGTPAETLAAKPDATSDDTTAVSARTTLVLPTGVILAVEPDRLVAVDHAGKRVWVCDKVDSGLTGAWLWGSTVLVTNTTKLWIVDAASGRVLTPADPINDATDLPPDHSALAIGDSAVFTADNAYVTIGPAIVAIGRNGSVVWTGQKPAAAVPVAANDRSVVAHSADSRQLGVFAMNNGDQKWTAPVGGGGGPISKFFGLGGAFQALVTDDVVVVSTGTMIRVFPVSGVSHTPIWHWPPQGRPQSPITSMAIVGDLLVFSSDNVYACALSNGADQWQHSLAAAQIAVSAASSVIVAAAGAQVVGLNVSHGHPVWSATIPAAVATGTVTQLSLGADVAYVTLTRGLPPAGSPTTPAPGFTSDSLLVPDPGDGPVAVVAIALTSKATR